MGALSMPAMLFIAFVVLQKFGELVLARRNTVVLLARGRAKSAQATIR